MIELERNLLKLNTYLNLERKPVGIKFLITENDFNSFKAEKLRNKMSYCTMVRNSMRGSEIKAKLENFACLAGAKALGVMKATNRDTAGINKLALGTYKDLTISRQIAKDMVFCEHEIYGVGIKPLENYNDSPDVVVMVTNTFNTMRLVQAYAYNFGQIKDVKVSGMQAICQECTSYPFEKNGMNISMLCAGTRLLCQWKDNEVGIGIPYNKFNDLIDGLEKTVNPIERNKRKKEIEGKMKENGIEDFQIIYNKNYDDGCYSGLE